MYNGSNDTPTREHRTRLLSAGVPGLRGQLSGNSTEQRQQWDSWLQEMLGCIRQMGSAQASSLSINVNACFAAVLGIHVSASGFGIGLYKNLMS